MDVFLFNINISFGFILRTEGNIRLVLPANRILSSAAPLFRPRAAVSHLCLLNGHRVFLNLHHRKAESGEKYVHGIEARSTERYHGSESEK